MGFDGIIISDGMEMSGLTQSAWTGESAIRAVEAGIDILLLPMDVEHTINSIENAVNSGRINEERINQSVERIWKMKHQTEVLKGANQLPFPELESVIGIPKHLAKAREIAKKSITVVKDNHNRLPLRPQTPLCLKLYRPLTPQTHNSTDP
jgi:beta-N-acetylhexosaminidase